MGIKELSKHLRSQSIVRLRLDGHTVGLRCTRYYPDTEKYCMYDFYLEDIVSNKELYKFLAGISSSLGVADLKQVNEQYVTADEQKLGIQAQELTNPMDITKVVYPLVFLYERGYLKAS